MREISVKTILNRHRRRDKWFLDDYSLNPYLNCGFNCVYCYIHGSIYRHKMEKGLAVKINAPTLLEKELMRRAGKREYGFIALSSSTEPWMKMEEEYRVTRRCLEIIAEYKFPVHCLTKSDLILRDIDLLEEININAILPKDLKRIGHGTLITFSLSTIDDEIARIFEPKAPKPSERLKVFRKIKNEGFFAGLAYIPVLPYISDSDADLEDMVRMARDLEADYIFIGALTLYDGGRKIYYNVLDKYFPELLPKYMEFYGKSNLPSVSYQRRLDKKARFLCEKYGVKYMLRSYI